jgi:hypothetical protein
MHQCTLAMTQTRTANIFQRTQGRHKRQPGRQQEKARPRKNANVNRRAAGGQREATNGGGERDSAERLVGQTMVAVGGRGGGGAGVVG